MPLTCLLPPLWNCSSASKLFKGKTQPTGKTSCFMMEQYSNNISSRGKKRCQPCRFICRSPDFSVLYLQVKLSLKLVLSNSKGFYSCLLVSSLERADTIFDPPPTSNSLVFQCGYKLNLLPSRAYLKLKICETARMILKKMLRKIYNQDKCHQFPNRPK